MRKVAALLDDPSTALGIPGLCRAVAYEPLDGGRPSVAVAWVDGRAPQGWLELDEHPRWDRGGVSVHRIAFFNRLPSLSRAAFVHHWTEQHAALAARHHPTMRRYVQNVVVSGGEIDGVAELGFASIDDMTSRVYDSDAGRRAIRDDVAQFIDPHTGVRVDGYERVLFDSRASSS